MTLHLTEEQERTLAMLAEAQDISEHEAAVRAISEAAERRFAPVRTLAARGRSR
ncbi:CopG family transcriptional regulator [Amycolatopsis sp. NPDC006131]|uniref:CopG family transcriptional regulator n=1 Tax=Amycolatopsis sp. NPDC006131 TaxID=3156731 RepID=UPI0033A1D66A